MLSQSFKIHLTVYVSVNLLLIGIWAAGGGGYFWPIWPILGWGIGVACHGAPIVAGGGSRRGGTRRRMDATSTPSREHATSVDDVAATIGEERPSLRPAAAPDG